jgi:cob(I)alamin adenosyltransferase
MSETPRGLRGQVLLYTGEGKGKTTAAFGVVLRAVGRGWKVSMIQFTKMGEWPPGEPMGEIAGAKRLAPDLEVISTGIGFVNILGDPYTLDEHRDAAQKGLALANEKVAAG